MLCLLALLATPRLEAQTPPNFETTRVAEGLYQFRWVGHNSMFLTTPDGVVVFDPINAEAATQLGREIKRVAPGQPLAALVYSHSDADHATGAPQLLAEMGAQDIPIIAHENLVPIFAAANSADQRQPNTTFSDRMAFEVGGRRIELYYVGPSHTDNMIVPFIPDVGVAFAVDFLQNDRVGFQDLPGWVFPEFFDAIAGTLKIPFQTMVFGHGPPGDRATVMRQIQYYDDLTAAVRQARAQGLSEDQAMQQIRLPAYASWAQYEQWLPLNVRAIYRWLDSEG
jgi:glyoxylase-like metal-dependent hydrolase (beta-lactamase superfamily II)